MKRISVDFDLCESNALCEAMAPDHFQVDDDDYLQVLSETVAPEDESQVQQAVAACPRVAISLLEG